MIKIKLNGKEKEFARSTNLQGLIGQCCPYPLHVIAEVNGNIVKKQSWESTQVSAGDTIELVTMVGGG